MRSPIPLALALCLAAGCGASRPAAQAAPTAQASNAPVTFGSLDAAVDGPHRPEADRARDRYRHPRETLNFFGIRPGQTVVELSPGGGWYTAILAPMLHDQGRLIAAIPAAEGPRARYAARFQEFVRARPDVYGNVRTVTLEPPAQVTLGEPGSADAVLTFRNIHGWVNDGTFDAVLAACFQVLRPGGTFGVEEHRANEGGDVRETSRRGYVPESYVIERARAAGFELVERSEINANPRDTKDHPEGVWTLPPTLRLGDRDRERYLAIGESDRMTLRFRRPGGA